MRCAPILALFFLLGCDDAQKLLSEAPTTDVGVDTGAPEADTASPQTDTGTPPAGCTIDADCPRVACQKQRCDAGTCVGDALPDGVPCSTGDKCLVGQVCAAGACTGGARLPCNDGDQCTADACVDGQCAYTALTGSCDDGNPCTVADYCSEGRCVGGNNACPCPDGSCAKYDKGDGCVGTLECKAAVCVVAQGTAPDCPVGALNQCMVQGCIEGTGTCGGIPVAKGTACTDGDPCTLGDACEAGVCKAGPRSCPCTADADCAPFDDDDRCNGALRCISGQCILDATTVVSCTDSGNACAAVACNPASGVCEPMNKDGEPCSDGDACTQFDSCSGGNCVGIAADCDDDNPCTSDTCGVDGGCLHTPLPGPCDDGNDCSDGDTCQAGACTPGADVCSCTVDADCTKFDDGDTCTGVLVCLGGKCAVKLGSTLTCDQAGATECLAKVCKNSACVDEPLNEGGLCSDGDACTTGDACSGGVCTPSGDQCACNPAPTSYLKCGDSFGWSNAAFGATKAISDWGSCAAGDWSAKEFAWPVFVTKPTKVTATLSNETVKTSLFVLHDEGEGCAPASCIKSHASSVTFVADVGEQVYVVVDAKEAADGQFDIKVECDTAIELTCDNGVDEDTDGATDCGDTDCADDAWCSTPEECGNGVDDDHDLQLDCADADCAATETCKSICTAASSPKAYCGFSQEYATGDTSVVANYNCFGATGLAGPEFFYTWTPTTSVNAVVKLTKSYFGAQVIVLEQLNNACNAQNCLAAGATEASFTAWAGTTYYLGVDGTAGGGTFQLKVECP